ncbi:hypothetical protein AWENTII_006571 [Aspergillus wentii]
MFRKFLPTEAITSSYSNAAERLQQIKAHIAPVAQVTQLKDDIIQHDWKNTLTSAKNNIVQQVTEHPYQTGLSLVCITTPQAVSGPILNSVGFGAVGPTAGTIASQIHSWIGSPVARGGYAIFTSAGMGGYGTLAVNGVIRGVGAVLGVRSINGTGSGSSK